MSLTRLPETMEAAARQALMQSRAGILSKTTMRVTSIVTTLAHSMMREAVTRTTIAIGSLIHAIIRGREVGARAAAVARRTP